MPRLAFRSLPLICATLAAAGGCASLPAPATPVGQVARFQQVLDSIQAASALEADEVASAPRIRLYVPPVGFRLDRYVETSFHLSGDAYVLVVAVDLDRRVRVLYPELPDGSGFAAQRESNRLPRFFAGFGTANVYGSRAYFSRYDITQRISPFGGGGVILAVASDRPLQFERLVGPDGYWDENELSQLVFDQTMPGAAYALGRSVVLTGQEYNVDYTTFTGDRSFAGYALAAYRLGDGCDLSSGLTRTSSYVYGWNGVRTPSPMTRFVGLFQRDGQTYARYIQGGCAGASYYDVPVAGVPSPVPPDSTATPDTSTKRKPIHPGAPRFPSVTADGGAAAGREVHVRLEPPVADHGRERPVVTTGLRFRTAGELPNAGDTETGVGQARESGLARVPQREVERHRLPERTLTPRPERVQEAQSREASVREANVREANVREQQPAREAPVREAPVREAPVREAPVREVIHREPVDRAPTPAAPVTP